MKKMGIIVSGLIFAVIIAGFVFMQAKSQKMTGQKNPLDDKGNAEQFVKRLDGLGYFKYADSSELDNLKKNMLENYDVDNELTTIWDDESVPKDYRYYFCDGENVYEEGGIIDLLIYLKPTFDKLNFKCEVTNHFEEWDVKNKWLNHRITINGTEYIIFKNFTATGWGEAPKRIAEILNEELSKQGKDEKIYLVSGGNEGRLIFLTDELYKYIYSVYRNPYWKPLELNEWAKVMGVKQMKLTE